MMLGKRNMPYFFVTAPSIFSRSEMVKIDRKFLKEEKNYLGYFIPKKIVDFYLDFIQPIQTSFVFMRIVVNLTRIFFKKKGFEFGSGTIKRSKRTRIFLDNFTFKFVTN